MKYINYHRRKEVKKVVTEVTTRVSIRLWLVVIILFVCNIYVAISSATYGTQVMALEKQMQTIAEDSKRIREQMVAQQSLQNISSKAEELGLIKPTDVVYLDAPSSLTAAF